MENLHTNLSRLFQDPNRPVPRVPEQVNLGLQFVTFIKVKQNVFQQVV